MGLIFSSLLFNDIILLNYIIFQHTLSLQKKTEMLAILSTLVNNQYKQKLFLYTIYNHVYITSQKLQKLRTTVIFNVYELGSWFTVLGSMAYRITYAILFTFNL